MTEQITDGITVNITEKNKPLFMSAIEMKLKSLEKIQKTCLKEKQSQAAYDLQPDINRLQELLKRLKPLKPVPLPMK